MTTQQQQQFIASIAPKAQEIQRRYGVPASIAIAQAALESGWGRSAPGNNLFGIKAGSSWQGGTMNVATHEFRNGAMRAETDAFRSYSSTEQSMENYGQFLAGNSRYAGVVGASNAHQATDALQRAGYATAPNYASTLKAIIDSNDLTRFDDASYRGYTEDATRFNDASRRLQLERNADPDPWKSFMGSFVQLLLTVFVQYANQTTGVRQPTDHQFVQPSPTPSSTLPAPLLRV